MAIDLEKNKEVEESVIELLASHTRLLIASDFDGTLSSFAERPEDALLEPEARVALRKLSELPNTFVAVISGRSLADLTTKFNQIERVRLVGSHGHEFDLDKMATLSDAQQIQLESAIQIVKESVKKHPGSLLEVKPHGVAFHFRVLSEAPTAELNIIKSKLNSLGEGLIRDGNKVLEYSIVTTDKGHALSRIQEQLTPSITFFIGDDVTDESAFKHLGDANVSVKVGDSETSATYRVSSIPAAIKLLIRISERRDEWMKNFSSSPIDEHLFLSDQRSMALVDSMGTVSWLCAPKFDGTPLFGSLVGGPSAGYFRVSGKTKGKQIYDDGLIGKTQFDGFMLTDFLDCSDGRTYQRAGRSDLIRIIEGSGTVEIEFAPKYNFGRVPTKLYEIENGLRIECGQQRAVLISKGVDWVVSHDGMHDVAKSVINLQNSRTELILLIGTASGSAPIEDTIKLHQANQLYWNSWSNTLKLPKYNSELVKRSASVLRGLCYGPTGAIAAAATTSLPETLGGGRNWDYRFCWPRDASLTATALSRLNATGYAMRLLDWILEVVIDSEDVGFLAPLYTVAGRAVPGEAEVPEAIGYKGSRPVRIGNLAAEQLQLDSLGPIAELMWKLAEKGGALTEEHLQLAERLVNLVDLRWNDKDSGIWEVRGVQRHFVHSKLMCWYTVNCCSGISKYLGYERSDWDDLATRIRTEIEESGFNRELNSYVAAYDLDEPDAALLWIILSGFHDPKDSRCLGTLDYIIKKLVHNDSVYRYHFDDALLGQEGEFIICRSWLIEALIKVGRKDEAKMYFDEMLSRMNNLGLLAEQWDVDNGCALGNYPQAYSHLGLINAACALED